jgi:hypothetical protein
MALTNPYEVQGVFKHAVRGFSGGILEDKRVQSPIHFSITKHFDTYTYPQKIVPYSQNIVSLGLGTGGTVQSLKIQGLVNATIPAASYGIIGVGQDGSGHAQLYYQDIGTYGNAATWTTISPANVNLTASAPWDAFYYKGVIYLASGGNNVIYLDPTSGPNNGTRAGVSYTNSARPVHHPLDDMAYFFFDNQVYKLDNATWDGSVLALPSNETITCGCAFGIYLAIATVSYHGAVPYSKVYLWDRDSSLTTVTDAQDWGEGVIRYLASLNNKLIGVQNYYTNHPLAIGKGRVFIKEGSGEFGVVLNVLTTDSTQLYDNPSSEVKENKLYFAMGAELDGDYRHGIWCVDEKGRATLDYVDNLCPDGDQYNTICSMGNLWWVSHSSNDSIDHTDITGAYSSSVPSIYESLIFSTIFITGRGIIIQNPAMTKKLIGAIVMTEPLTTGQSVVMKYRTDTDLDDATAWTTILTHNTVGQTTHYALNIESTGGDLPNYNEIQFRLESYGGAVITGFEYGGEVIDNGLM